jgi:hypothetical protein
MAQSPVDAARALFVSYHEDLKRLDRARDLLEAAAEGAPTPEVLTALARAWLPTSAAARRDDGRSPPRRTASRPTCGTR